MYAVINTTQIQLGQIEKATRLYQEQVLPLVHQLAGFQSLKLLVDHSTSMVVIFALYDTQEHALAVPDSEVYRQALEALQEVLAGNPERRVYEIVLEV